MATRRELEAGQLANGRMNGRRFAEHVNVAHGTVKRWVHEGLPVERYSWGNGTWIDPVEGEEWIRRRFGGRKTVAFNRKSVLYFIQREDGAIKLGWTSDITRRTHEVRKECGQAVHLLACWPGAKPDELRLHERLQPHHIHGEWYEAAPEVLALVESVSVAA